MWILMPLNNLDTSLHYNKYMMEENYISKVLFGLPKGEG